MKNVFPSVIRKVFVGLGAVLVLGFVAWTSAGGIKTTHAATPCIVTIFGKQYDVAPLGVTHPGPKGTTLIDLGGSTFFQCGGDMTAIYQAQHGTDVTRMTPYIYVVPTATPSPTTEPSITPSPSVTPSVSPSVTPSVSPTPPVNDDHDSDDVNESQEEVHEDVHAEVHENTEVHEKESNEEVRKDNRVNQSAHVETNVDVALKHDD